MKKIVLLLFKAHKYTGIIISGFFLMWFVTGVILIYHSYPKLSESEYNSMKETLPSSLPELAYMQERIDGEPKSLRIRQFQGQTIMDIRTEKGKYQLTSDTLNDIKPIDFRVVLRVKSFHRKKQ